MYFLYISLMNGFMKSDYNIFFTLLSIIIVGKRADGSAVFLADIWPSRDEIQQVEQKYVIPAMFKEVHIISKTKLIFFVLFDVN